MGEPATRRARDFSVPAAARNTVDAYPCGPIDLVPEER